MGWAVPLLSPPPPPPPLLLLLLLLLLLPLLLLQTHVLTAEFFTPCPVTASMNLRLTIDRGQGKRRNMRRIVPDTLGKRKACSFENTIVLCMPHWPVLLVQAKHTSNEPSRPMNFFPLTLFTSQNTDATMPLNCSRNSCFIASARPS
jgi:hypothetical protein